MMEDDRYRIQINQLPEHPVLGLVTEKCYAHLDHCVRHAFESGDSTEISNRKPNKLHAVLKPRANK